MDIKSRYEVISELEQQKRELILERDTLQDLLLQKERELKDIERRKEDSVREFDRKIADMKEATAHFKKTMDERKETIKELIKSVDDSLGRFSKLQEKDKKE